MLELSHAEQPSPMEARAFMVDYLDSLPAHAPDRAAAYAAAQQLKAAHDGNHTL